MFYVGARTQNSYMRFSGLQNAGSPATNNSRIPHVGKVHSKWFRSVGAGNGDSTSSGVEGWQPICTWRKSIFYLLARAYVRLHTTLMPRDSEYRPIGCRRSSKDLSPYPVLAISRCLPVRASKSGASIMNVKHEFWNLGPRFSSSVGRQSSQDKHGTFSSSTHDLDYPLPLNTHCILRNAVHEGSFHARDLEGWSGQVSRILLVSFISQGLISFASGQL